MNMKVQRNNVTLFPEFDISCLKYVLSEFPYISNQIALHYNLTPTLWYPKTDILPVILQFIPSPYSCRIEQI